MEQVYPRASDTSSSGANRLFLGSPLNAQIRIIDPQCEVRTRCTLSLEQQQKGFIKDHHMLTRRFGLLPTSESHLGFGPEFNPFFVHIELYALSGAKQKKIVRHFASERDKPVAFDLTKLAQ